MNMFTWLNNQGVQSDNGFVVQTRDRFTIEYREGSRTVSVYVEIGMLGGTKPCVSIKPTSFERWDDDSPYTVLPLEKQDEMLSNFTEAMEFQGVAVAVE